MSFKFEIKIAEMPEPLTIINKQIKDNKEVENRTREQEPPKKSRQIDKPQDVPKTQQVTKTKEYVEIDPNAKRHQHICQCGTRFSHMHVYTRMDHTMIKGDCPNPSCGLTGNKKQLQEKRTINLGLIRGRNKYDKLYHELAVLEYDNAHNLIDGYQREIPLSDCNSYLQTPKKNVVIKPIGKGSSPKTLARLLKDKREEKPTAKRKQEKTEENIREGDGEPNPDELEDMISISDNNNNKNANKKEFAGGLNSNSTRLPLIKAFYGRIEGINLGKNYTDENGEFLKDLFNEFAITTYNEKKKQNKKTFNPDMIYRVYTEKNKHDFHARIRLASMQTIVLHYAKNNGYNFTETWDWKLKVPIWSIAGNFERLCHFTNTIISNNPTLSAADEVRKEKITKFIKERNDVVFYYDTKPCYFGTLPASLLGYYKNNTAVDRQKITKTIQYSILLDVDSNGWCGYEALYLLNIHNCEQVLAEHRAFYIIYKLALLGFNEDILEKDGNFYKPQDLSSTLNYVEAFLAVRQNIDSYRKIWLDIEKIQQYKDQTTLILDYEQFSTFDKETLAWSPKQVNNESNVKEIGPCLVWCAMPIPHFMVLPQKTQFNEVVINGCGSIVGIHTDVHYYPEVLDNICRASHDFPQYIHGWKF